MKARILLTSALLLAAALAGCSRDGHPAADPVKSAMADRPERVSDVNARLLTEPLPNGMELSFPYHLRRDAVEEVDPGVLQRRVRVEYFELSQQQAVEAIKADHAAAGYRISREMELDNGRVRIVFRHPNEDRSTVTVLTDTPLTKPSANGMIYIHIPVQAPAENGGDG